MTWLTQENAIAEAESKVEELRHFVASRSYKQPVTDISDDILQAVAGMNAAARDLLRDWFFASLGVMDVVNEKDRETYYLSRSPDSYYFSTLNVVPWTNWLGSVYTALSEASRRGKLPSRLRYGPGDLAADRDIGPLVNYTFDHGAPKDAQFLFHKVASSPTATTQPETPTFGLKDIVTTIDTTQDERLRSSMSGVYIFTGGAGVGKTTVALHRLPFLINEQNANPTGGVDHYTKRDNLFFTEKTMAVLVWKDHLVPYLETCLKDLGLERVRVQHVEDWVSEHIRPHVQFGIGAGKFELEADPENIADLKLAASEQDLESFLDTEHPLLADMRERYTSLHADVNTWLREAGRKTVAHDPPTQFAVDDVGPAFESLAVAVEGAVEGLLKEIRVFDPGYENPNMSRWSQPSSLENIQDPVAKQLEVERRKHLRDARANGIALLSKATSRLSQEKSRVRGSAARLLLSFYESAECEAAVSRQYSASEYFKLKQHLKSQRIKKTLSYADRYLALWIVRLVARNDTGKAADVANRLPEYSHVMVDEAQYYRPHLLRLLHDVTLAPHKSMTIVGDLEQRIHSDGGLAAWDAAGIVVPDENVQRLATNYRWSKSIFRFLRYFREAAGLPDTLREPDVWYSGDGRRPDIMSHMSRDVECAAVVERVVELKESDTSSRWSVAIVLPYSDDSEVVRDLISRLKRCAIRARWAVGPDLRESKEHVVLTNYDSVVGLEFDAVVLACSDDLLRGLGKDESIRAIWVAITRPRRYELISYVGDVPAFAHQLLEPYHATVGESPQPAEDVEQ